MCFVDFGKNDGIKNLLRPIWRESRRREKSAQLFAANTENPVRRKPAVQPCSKRKQYLLPSTVISIEDKRKENNNIFNDGVNILCFFY